MKKSVVLSLLFLCLVMFGCAKDQTVATVNGVELSAADFNRNLESSVNLVKRQNPQFLQQPFANDIFGKQVLNDMVVRELFIQQAKKSKIEATKEEIDSVITRIKNQFKVNSDGKELTPKEQEKAFQKATKGTNLEANVANDIIAEKYRKALISTNLKPVNKEDVKTFFENVSAVYKNDTKKIEELKKQGRYEESEAVAKQLDAALAPKAQFDLILVYADKKMGDTEFAQRKNIADAIKKEINDGANFAEVAQKYAQQEGSKIYFSKMNVFEGMQPVELTSKAFKLDKGEVSDIFEIFTDSDRPGAAQGFFIMNVVEKAPAQKFAFETFEKQLEDYINSKRAESIIKQAAQSLIKDADVKIIKTFEMDKKAEQYSKKEAAK